MVGNSNLEALHNPEVVVEIVTGLFYGPMRAAHLVRSAASATSVSEPTVYAVLKELLERRLVEKVERSRRNVVYKLTPAGEKLLAREQFHAVDKLLSTVENPTRKRELMVALLLEDLLSELPKEWKTDDRREMLRKSLSGEMDDLKKRLVRIASAITL